MNLINEKMMRYGMQNKIELLRIVGNIEGWSYIVLLFVAMPLKYFGEIAIAVKIAGMAHGLLFVMFVWVLLGVLMRQSLSLRLGLYAFIASLLPFGTFFLNKKLVRLQVRLAS